MLNATMNLHNVTSVVASPSHQSMAAGMIYTSRTITVTTKDGAQFEISLYSERGDQIQIDEVGK